MKDKLIAMGFEELDIADYVRQYEPHDNQEDFFDGGDNVQPTKAKLLEIVIEVASMPELEKLSDEEQSQLTTATTDEGTVIVKIRGEVSSNLQKVIVKSAGKPASKKSIQQNLRIHNARIEILRSPAERGEVFG